MIKFTLSTLLEVPLADVRTLGQDNCALNALDFDTKVRLVRGRGRQRAPRARERRRLRACRGHRIVIFLCFSSAELIQTGNELLFLLPRVHR